MRFKNSVLLLAFLAICSCSEDESELTKLGDEASLETKALETFVDPEIAKKNFAVLLSKAVANDRDLRQFIKDESIAQFDNDYDVFYPFVKNKVVKDDKTFRDILLTYCENEEELRSIEFSLPLLNIYIPDFSGFTDVTANNLDVEDDDLPVATFNKKEGVIFYENGDSIMKLQKGEIPGFHLLLIKDNERLRQKRTMYKSAYSINDYEFIDPVFDGSIPEISYKSHTTPQDEIVPSSQVNPDVAASLEIWKSEPAKQRDYIYYGITPSEPNGSYKIEMQEYLYRFQIDPATYYKIADQPSTNIITGDPKISGTTSQEKSEMPTNQILDNIWTDGNFEIQFIVYDGQRTAGELTNSNFIFECAPWDLFKITIDTDRRHPTTFRHTKYTYSIDPEKFDLKWYYVEPNKGYCSLGDWNLGTKGLTKHIDIYELDASQTISETVSYSETFVNTTTVTGEMGIPIGETNLKIGAGYTTSNTSSQSESTQITTNADKDYLGGTDISFYYPVVDAQESYGYRIKAISVGSVAFCTMPRKSSK